MQRVVERVFHTTISERGAVVGARFRPGGFAARFDRDAAAMTGRVQPVDDELFGASIQLDDDVDSAAARLDELIATATGEPGSMYVALTSLIDRMRDDDRLHRVEQVMQRSRWSARTTQRAFRRCMSLSAEVGVVPIPVAASRVGDREQSRRRLRRPGDPPRLVRPGAFHQRLPHHAGLHSGGVRRPARRVIRYAAAVDPRDLAFAGAAEQARMLAAGSITAPELLEVYLDRIARLDRELRSYRVVLADSARKEAGVAQERLNAGERLPLLGVPIAIKDDVDIAGEVTTYGKAAYGPAPAHDAEVVREAARGRRRHRRQDRRSRDDDLVVHRDGHVRCDAQPVEHRLHAGRQQRWQRRRDCGRHGGDGAGDPMAWGPFGSRRRGAACSAEAAAGIGCRYRRTTTRGTG